MDKASELIGLIVLRIVAKSVLLFKQAYPTFNVNKTIRSITEQDFGE